jgi:hypothetical protein
MLPMLACIAGIYMGLNFSVLALLPFTGFGALLVLTASTGEPLTDVLVVLLFSMIAAQAGYILGLTMRENYVHLLIRLNIRQSNRA